MGLPKEIADFMAKYGVTADEVWKIPQGSAYAVKHKALERVAAEQKIRFGPPNILQINLETKAVAMCVDGAAADGRMEWATGEAAPYNNKNGYPLAMAEKRAKDRVVLKLLQAHGALYSEDEADDFKQPKRENPHVTKPEDILPAAEYDERGEPVDNIPRGEEVDRLPKAKARADFEAAQNEMRGTRTERELKVWAERNATRIASYPVDWEAMFRGLYIEHRDSLRKEAA